MTTVLRPTTTVGRQRLPVAVPVAIALAWGAAIAVHITGHADAIDHDGLLGGEARPSSAAVVGYAGAWTAMVIAMMLPSAVPLVRLFAGASANQPHPRLVMSVFVCGYLAVWIVFGWLALSADAAAHQVFESLPWLDRRPGLVVAAVLAVAGAFQFSALKDACLRTCRHPAAYLLRHYRRGIPSAFRIGWRHGLFCVGCCWALMLVAFAVGMADVRWMAAFTALMTYEKVGRRGEWISRVAGFGLLGLAAAAAGSASL